MDEPATSGPERILIIGRSPGVILDAAGILRGKGFRADATNQFDEVLTEYDTTNIDVVVFGGMVPPDAKQYLNCDMRSHAASGCVERRVGLCRGRSPGQRRKTCPRRDVRAGLLGWRVRSSRESPRVPDPSGGHRRGEGRAGVNASELLLMPR